MKRPNTRERREAMVERIADQLLAAGLGEASLRPLAKAAGTSDRMLLYYFADRAELLSVALARVAGRLASVLDAAVPAGSWDGRTLLTAVWAAAQTPAVQPYMRLWLELAAAASRGQEPERTAAGAIATGLHGWLAGRLGDGGDGSRAAALMVQLEGLVLLDAIGAHEINDLALSRLIGDAPAR